MYLIIPYLSYVSLGLFTILITTYLIPILKFFQTKYSKKKSNILFLYIGFLISHYLIYFGLNLIKNNVGISISNFFLLLLFTILIIQSISLIFDIYLMEILGGIKIKQFNYSQLTSFIFGLKFATIQIFSNPIFLLILIINIFNLTPNTDSLNNISIYLLGFIITIYTITKLSTKKYNWLIQKISYKQKLINIISSIITLGISFLFISNLI